MVTSSIICDVISFFLKKIFFEKIFHISWTTWGILLKFSEKIWLMIILKDYKAFLGLNNSNLAWSSERTFGLFDYKEDINSTGD